MRKNQKYSKEEMYRAIEQCQESGLSQVKFCSRENLSVKTFSYWLRKYRQEKGLSPLSNRKGCETFIPVEVSKDRTSNGTNTGSGQIEIFFPNGVQMSCPVGIDIDQLKSLINF